MVAFVAQVKPETAARKRARGMCVTPRCRNAARAGRTMCNTCRARLYNDPLKRLFWNLRAHAKARGKVFTLTWEDFAEMARASGYEREHGRGSAGLTVDRIDPALGYVRGNVQVIPNALNARKSWAERAGWRPPGLRDAEGACGPVLPPALDVPVVDGVEVPF